MNLKASFVIFAVLLGFTKAVSASIVGNNDDNGNKKDCSAIALKNPLLTVSNAITLRQCFTDVTLIVKGNFGKQVSKAKLLEDNKFYAIKEVPRIEKLLKPLRFRELEVWKRVTPHPYINTLHGSWMEEKTVKNEDKGKVETTTTVFYQSELCREDLWRFRWHLDQNKEEHTQKKARSEGVLPEPMIWQVLKEMLAALDRFHSQGLVFVDMKMLNILVCDNDVKASSSIAATENKNLKGAFTFRLIDFGMVYDLEKDTQETAEWICGVMDGGRSWQHVDDAQHQCKMSAAADIAQLGLLALDASIGYSAYNALTGKSLAEIRTLVIDEQQKGEKARFSPKLGNIIVEMIASEPKDRPSAKTLLESPNFL